MIKSVNSKLLFIAIFILSSPIISIQSKTVEYPDLYTRITNIDWEFVTIYSDLTFENISFFNFTIDYELLNLNDSTFTITFPHCNLFFEANMSINFANPAITTIPYVPIGLCSATDFIVKSGVTSGSVNYKLIFEDSSIEMLPDGEYELWIYGYDLDNVVSSVSMLIVDGSDIDIVYGDFKTENAEISFVLTIFALIFGSLVSFRTIKRKSKIN